MTIRTAALTILVMTATALTAAGCGRKGDLERPSVARAQAQKDAKAASGGSAIAPSARRANTTPPDGGAVPASAAVAGTAATQTTSVTQMNVISGSDGAAGRSGRKTDKEQVEDRPFILDPLL
jgi:predicted small lipoprotein YifL